MEIMRLSSAISQPGKNNAEHSDRAFPAHASIRPTSRNPGTHGWSRLGQLENSAGGSESGALLNSVLSLSQRALICKLLHHGDVIIAKISPQHRKGNCFTKYSELVFTQVEGTGRGEWAKLAQFPALEAPTWTAYPASLSTCFVKWGCWVRLCLV